MKVQQLERPFKPIEILVTLESQDEKSCFLGLQGLQRIEELTGLDRVIVLPLINGIAKEVAKLYPPEGRP